MKLSLSSLFFLIVDDSKWNDESLFFPFFLLFRLVKAIISLFRFLSGLVSGGWVVIQLTPFVVIKEMGAS